MVRSVFERFVEAHDEYVERTMKEPTMVRMTPELWNNLMAVSVTKWRRVGLQVPHVEDGEKRQGSTVVRLTENVVTGDFEFE